MNTLILSTGSNLGNRQLNLESATQQIELKLGKIRKCSAIYESRSWGYESENLFYNQCLEIKTEYGLGDCLDLIQEIEESFDRKRVVTKYLDRSLDIDILFYNKIISDTEPLKVPHPRMHKRRFVLLPLVEILPDLVHPIFHKTVSELLVQCEDSLEVIPVS